MRPDIEAFRAHYWGLARIFLLRCLLISSICFSYNKTLAAQELDAIDLCNRLGSYVQLGPDEFKVSPRMIGDSSVDGVISRSVGVILEIGASYRTGTIIPSATAILIDENVILTVEHEFKLQRDYYERVVLFGCTGKKGSKADANHLIPQAFRTNGKLVLSSPQAHLDYSLIAIARNPTEASNYESYLDGLKPFGGEIGCVPIVGSKVLVAGYSSVEYPRVLNVLGDSRTAIRAINRFTKTAGNVTFIDYWMNGITRGYSGAALLNEKGCLLGMHHRRLSQIRYEYGTKWDPYISQYYPQCYDYPKPSRPADPPYHLSWISQWDDDCLPGQSNWIVDIALDAAARHEANPLFPFPEKLGEIVKKYRKR
jgi:hypothetical protein